MTLLVQLLVVRVDPGEERRSVVLQDDWIPTDARIGKSPVLYFVLLAPTFLISQPRGRNKCHWFLRGRGIRFFRLFNHFYSAYNF